MTKLGLGLALVLALPACGKSKCEKYADMEWKCGNYPESEKDITLKMAEGMCEAADKEKTLARFAKEADCAEKAKDCAAYKACSDAIAE